MCSRQARPSAWGSVRGWSSPDGEGLRRLEVDEKHARRQEAAASGRKIAPRGWMILDRFVRRRDDDSFPDGSWSASLTNSRGDPFDVCLLLNAPPRPSGFYLRWPKGPAEGEPLTPVTADNSALLLLMHYTVPVLGDFPFPMIDYFVYSIGHKRDSNSSLHRLPPLGGTIAEVQARVAAEGIHASKRILRRMESQDIGIIYRGPEDFAVAELHLAVTPSTARPELTVFNPSVSEQWVLKLPRVVPVYHNEGMDMDRILWYWDTDAVVPFGSWLCWVDYSSNGVMLCNIFEEDPEILFLELPTRQKRITRSDNIREGMEAYHALGTTACGSILKFAFVFWPDVMVRRTCDPDLAKFSVTTWKLRIAGKDMVWIEDGWLQSYDLWTRDDFSHIPRIPLLFPVFSVDDSNEITFLSKLPPREQEDGGFDPGQIWLVSIDMVTKKLNSSILYVEDGKDSTPEETELFERKDQVLDTFLPVTLLKDLELHVTSIRRPKAVESGWIDPIIRSSF